MSDIYSLDRIEPPMAVLIGDDTQLVPWEELPGHPREGDMFERTPEGWRARPDLTAPHRAAVLALRADLLERGS